MTRLRLAGIALGGGVLLMLSGCATDFNHGAGRNIHLVAIEAPANPDGYVWPFNLEMFKEGIPPYAGTGPVAAGATGLFTGFAKGANDRATARAVVSADNALIATNERLGDELASYVADRLRENGFVVSLGTESAPADVVLTIEIDAVGYACDGLLLDGQCKPRIHSHFILRDKQTGNRLYDKKCYYGIKSSLLGDCSMEADETLIVSRIGDVLANPSKSNANLREGAKQTALHVAKDLAPQ